MTFLKRGNNRHLIHLLMLVLCFLYLLFMSDGCYTIEAFFMSGLDVPTYLILFFIGIVLFGSYFLFAYRNFKIKTKPVLLAIFASIFVIQTIGVLAFRGVFDTGELMYSLTPFLRAQFIFEGFFLSVGFYALFAIAPQCIRSVHFGRIIAYLILLLVSVLVIYSLITEMGLYIEFLKEGPTNAFEAPKSLTWNRNTFGYWLLMGTLSCYYLYYPCKRLWWWIPIALLSFIQVFTMCKTSLIIQAIVVLAMVIHFVVTSFKKHKVISILMLAVVALGVFLVVWKADAFISLMKGAATSTINDRLVIWNDTMDLLDDNPGSWAFGLGGMNFPFALNIQNLGVDGVGALASVDSGLFEIIGRYGIIGLIVYCAFLAYIVLLFVKASKKKYIYLIPTIFVFVATLLHGITEITYLLSFSMRNSIVICFIMIPLSNFLEERDVLREKKVEVVPYTQSDIIKTFMFFFNFVFAFMLGPIAKKFNFSSPYLMALAAILYVYLPFLITGVFRRLEKNEKLLGILPLILFEGSIICYFVGGFTSLPPLYLFIAGVVLFIASFFVSYYRNGKIPSLFADIWPYVATFILVTSINLICNAFVPMSKFYPLMMVAFDSLIFVLVFIASPFAQYSLAFSNTVDRIEIRSYELIDKIEDRFNPVVLEAIDNGRN